MEVGSRGGVVDKSGDVPASPGGVIYEFDNDSVSPGLVEEGEGTIELGYNHQIFFNHKSRNQAIDKLPDWMSKGKTSHDMTNRKKRTTLEMNKDNLNDQSIKGYYDMQYSTAWKEATI